MKKTIMLVVFALSAIIAPAQDSVKVNNHTGYLGISICAMSPIGDFASAEKGGASSGYNANLNFSYPLIKKGWLGITTKVDMAGCAASAEPLVYEQQTFINNIGAGNDYYTVAEKGGSYSMVNIMTGFYLTFPLKRLSFDYRVLGGYNMTSRTETQVVTTNVHDATDYGYETRGASNSSGSVLDLGLSIRLNLGKKQHFCIFTNIDFMVCNGSFASEDYSFYTDGATGLPRYGTHTATHETGMNSLNFGIGVGYVFHKKAK